MQSTGGSITLERKTILLVEQDLPTRKFLSELLLQQGCVLVEAHSGPDALKGSEMHNGAIDLLLTDCALPGMSGLELAEQLWRSRPDLPVILMSASSEETAVSHIRGLPFIRKPFTPDTVTGTIERTLGHANNQVPKTKFAG